MIMMVGGDRDPTDGDLRARALAAAAAGVGQGPLEPAACGPGAKRHPT